MKILQSSVSYEQSMIVGATHSVFSMNKLCMVMETEHPADVLGVTFNTP